MNRFLSQKTGDIAGFTPETLNVRPDIGDSGEPIESWPFGAFRVEARRGRDAFWIKVTRWEKGRDMGGVALRTFPILGPYTLTDTQRDDNGAEWTIATATGTHHIRLRLIDGKVVRMTSILTPRCNLLVAFWPRDLYPINADNDPVMATGTVMAAQRGLNTGLVYLHIDASCANHVLYVQNLTALNPFFTATKTRPDGVVGGEWPELGYLPPAAPNGYSPPVNPLKCGTAYTISDALLALRPATEPDELSTMRQFIDMMADMYPHLDKPEPAMPDWYGRAGRTLHDLKTSADVMVESGGRRYLHPYLASEYPDSMVQMTVLASLREYEHVYGHPDPLSEDLAVGMRAFYDDNLKTLRRYLPDVGVDKSRDIVDAWYLYHPLMNLARLALKGEAWARNLFFDSLDFAMRAARHFDYVFPITYDLRNFAPVEKTRGEEGLGQTDAGGLYAYVMVQAYELSHDQLYVEEAKAALKAMEGLGFELAYQTNLTAWGAVACLKLSRLLKDRPYLDQSFVFIASWLHNCELWHSQLGHAGSHANFFGLTCLHDGPYMAAYEAFESFAAFDEYLQMDADSLPDSVRFLLSEYWRQSLDVLWSFYPDTLPEDALAKDVRNGHIDRQLSFPLEDIYGDGGPAGRVGQEIYGCGAAFILAARAYAECEGAPFRLYADRPFKVVRTENDLSIRFIGVTGQGVRLRVTAREECDATPVLRDERGAELAAESADGYRLACGYTYRLGG